MSNKLMNKAANQIATTMMSHYENWNVVTDGAEIGEDLIESGKFTDEWCRRVAFN